MGYTQGVMFETLDDRFRKSLPQRPKWHGPVMFSISLLLLLLSIVKLLRF